MPSSPSAQLLWLFVLALPVACISRTLIFEEISREAHEFFARKSKNSQHLITRKFFYLLTCEYCFSHYVALFFLALTQFKLLIGDWRGSVIAFFALVFVANIYLNIYSRLRVDIEQTKVNSSLTRRKLEKVQAR